jgi:DNA-binding transcriptional regulator LsrR (DeoR family)
MQIVEARMRRDIGELLQELYHEKGNTQAQIADALGVDVATVSRWMTLLGIEARYLGPRRAA